MNVVREMMDAFLRGDVTAALETYDPDVEWDGTNLPDGKISRGREAIVDHLARWVEQWNDWRFEVEEYIDAGDQVLVLTHERGRSKSGLDMDERHAELYRVRDGKIVWRKGFSDPEEGLAAAGLSR